MNNLHIETVSATLLQIIKTISASPHFTEFRLCGGTALALQTGHRISLDADYVTEKKVSSDKVILSVNGLFKNTSDVNTGTHGLFLKINNCKVDFLSWQVSFIREAVLLDGIKMIHIEEIIAMKLFAITQRGEKKDYMDIATLLERYKLTEMINFYKERHPGSDDLTVIRFLTSYSDVENQPEPHMLHSLSWSDCKKKLQLAVRETFGK